MLFSSIVAYVKLSQDVLRDNYSNDAHLLDLGQLHKCNSCERTFKSPTNLLFMQMEVGSKYYHGIYAIEKYEENIISSIQLRLI